MSRAEYEPLVRDMARRYGLDEDIIVVQVQQESSFDAGAVSPSGGHVGLMQLSTQYYGDRGNLFDPFTNVQIGCQIVASDLAFFGDDYQLAMAAFNAGRQAMKNWRDRFGDGWRAALRENAGDWWVVATYGTARKAQQVALYLDKILGPEGETAVANVVDMRGQLPTYTGGQPYGRRALAAIQRSVIHFTAGSVWDTAESTARYQTSWDAAPQTGVGTPFPALAYHLFVEAPGRVVLAHDLETETWHATTRNATSVAVCYAAAPTGSPNPAQLAGMAEAVVWCEQQLGRPLPLEPHRAGPGCPGPGWATWRPELERLIQARRTGEAPVDVSSGFRVSAGFVGFLRGNPEYGVARMDEWELPGFGKALLCKPSEASKLGVVLVERHWTPAGVGKVVVARWD